ncbi:glycosyltransferase family 4 protein [Aphanizomenon sp. UHCC 0183]|uniref:glycosyltransferase family 4 protein n=1 Tax=Aphanizomenon sp. UHCC 0183 TaxID=2590028 RepID=UPI001446526C|nr:glycosyltransferase family 4 protein [Aphanizomenon sp. UHCC 0183]MTJ29926.1 glycosyltransferase [Aphanizomenon sp. UHCC 0183]
MKSILFVTRDIASSNNHGVKIREIGIARQLNKHFHVDIAYQNYSCLENIDDLPFRKLIYIPNSKLEVLIRTLKSFFTCSSFHKRFINYKLINFIESSEYDFVYFSWIYTAINIQNIRSAKFFITDLVDANSLHYSESNPKSVFRKIYYSLEKERLLQEEILCLNKSDITILSTIKEREYLEETRKNDGHKNILVVTNGVDIPEKNLITKPTILSEFRIGFIGSLNWYPNQEAVEILIEEIFPPLKKQFGNLQLYIIGRENPSIQAKFSNVPDLFFTGFIENLEEILPSIDMMIFPLKVASGIQNKLITSFAYGIPAIFPPRMIFQPEMDHLKELCVATDSKSYIDKASRLINSHELRSEIATWSRNFVEEHLSWERTTEQLVNYLKDNANKL